MYLRDALCLRGQAAVEHKTEKLEAILEKYQSDQKEKKEEKPKKRGGYEI